MAKDVIITPLSGLVDFQSSSTSQATIELDDSNNLKLSSSGGTVQIGNASSDVYIGTGAATVDIIFQQDGSVRGTGSETICLGMSGDNIILPAGVDFAIGTTSFAQNATTTHLGNMSFGLPGNGSNTCGRFISIEGNTDNSGEGSGRIFFTEHNSTTAGMSKYGMSIGYRGGNTCVAGADGSAWCGLTQIGNGCWGMWGHDNSVDGSLIMYGNRQATFVCFNNNTVRTSSYVYAGQFIDNDNNSCLVNPSATSYLNALCVNAGLTVDGTTYLSENYNRICLGNSTNTSTAECVGLYLHQSSYTDGRYTHRLRKYDHGGGVPLYIDSSGGTANVFSACARFGTYTGNSNAFEVFGNAGVTGQLCISSAATGGGNLKFTGAANPYICASSYIHMPGGLYVNGGTLYVSNQTRARGGICNDGAAWLCIYGGTAGDTSFGGNVGIGTTDPTVALDITCTGVANSPTLRLNNTSSSAFIHSLEACAPNLASGQTNILVVGKAACTKNSGYIGYYWTSDASNSNFVSIGHWGSDHRLRVYGDGMTCATGALCTGGNIVAGSCLAVAGGNSAYLRDITGDYGSIEIANNATNGWHGYSINGRTVFMHDNNFGSGIFNDVDNEWFFYATRNAETRMYHNGTARICTTGSGAYISQSASGNYGLEVNGAPDGKIVLSGSTNPYIRFQEGTTDKAYLQWHGSDGAFIIANQEDNRRIYINNDLCFYNGTGCCTVWHAGNICPAKTHRPYLTNTTTACLMAQIQSCGLFTDTYASAFKAPWDYAGNADLTDAGRLTELAGTSWLTWTDNCTSATRGNITALVIAPTTGGSANKVFIYNDQGSSYAPGWREVWTNASDGSGSGLDADLLDGVQGASFLRSDTADTFTGTLTMGTQKALVANNYGRGVYGLYNASRYQHVWSMGTSYNLADNGTTPGNLYGLAWTHTNVGGQSKTGLSHQLLLMMNGSTYTALGDGIWTAGRFTSNDDGADQDFRVEAQSTSTGPLGNKEYAIFVDASAGAVGIGTSQPSYALEVNGTAFVTGTFSAGTKNFLIDHPTKENYMLRHGSLEGPENAVYVRGTTTSSSIELPEYWTGLVDEDTITATLTPRGKYLQLFLDRVEDNEIHVGGTEIGELYDYVIYGTRKDVEDLIVEFERPVGS